MLDIQLEYPDEEGEALNTLADVLNLSESNQPHLEKIILQLPFSPRKTSQLDVAFSKIIGNLSYVKQIELDLIHATPDEDGWEQNPYSYTWDFSSVIPIWDYIESLKLPANQSDSSISSRSAAQTVKLNARALIS